MSISDDIKAVMVGNAPLMLVLTGGVFNDVEEISRQNTSGAFDVDKEIKPCALIKFNTEIPFSAAKIANAVQTPITIYFYERAGYANIEAAMGMTFDLLNDTQIGTSVWRVEFDIAVYQQRDTALDCPLGSLRFVAKRLR